MNDLTVRKEENSAATIHAPGSVLDPERFGHMYKWAEVLASTSLLPESLYKEKDKPLDPQRVIANCFLIVDQADRWGFSPIAVAQATAIVHGKLCYEGKLVAAVIQAKLGVNLHHHFTGDGLEKRIYVSDQPFDAGISVVGEDGATVTGPLVQFLKPGFRHPAARLVDGSVSEWKTGEKGPWVDTKNHVRMLIYRGTREWCRFYEPALMLGVYTPDELDDLGDSARASRARDVTPAKPTVGAQLQNNVRSGEGFSAENIEKETAALSAAGDKPSPEDKSEEMEAHISAEERVHLKQFIIQCRASVGDDPAVVVNTAKGFNEAGHLKSQIARDKAGTITRSFVSVCKKEASLEAAVEYTCGIIGIDAADLEKSE